MFWKRFKVGNRKAERFLTVLKGTLNPKPHLRVVPEYVLVHSMSYIENLGALNINFRTHRTMGANFHVRNFRIKKMNH